MSDKVPQLKLTDDKITSVRVWIIKFNSHCLMQDGWRDLTKTPAQDDHWIEEAAQKEIAAFFLGLPDDVLTDFTVNVFPKMSVAEKGKAKCYPEKLEAMFQGQDNVMPERNSFFNCLQGPLESVAKYETRIRQAMKNTRYKDMTNPEDELMRDRFCTGVKDKTLRGQLLTHFKEDGITPWTFDEKLTKAKSWEAAHTMNDLIEEQRSGTAENVNYTAKYPYRSRPQTAQNTTRGSSSYNGSNNCNWCGGSRHPRERCPAKKPGTYCTNCFMKENHLTKVCKSTKDKYKDYFFSDRNKGRTGQPAKEANATEAEYCDHDADYVVHSFNAYHITGDIGDKYFTWLPVSISPSQTKHVLLQVDSAATCNTLPSDMFHKILPNGKLKRSNAKIKPYSGDPFTPLGKQTLTCEGANDFVNLDFEVIDSAMIPGKPALLSGKDSKRLGLVTFNKDKVFASASSTIKPPNPRDIFVHSVTTKQDPRASTAQATPGELTENIIKTKFPDNFKGLGLIGKPVHIETNPDVKPFHAAVHRIPVSKHAKVKAKLDEMVAEGKLEKVNTPTAWCNNMTVRERILPDKTEKVRICIDPSQAVNKAIIVPRYQIPTTNELLPQLAGHKYKTFSIFDALDGFTQLALDEESSLLTTMHTPWGRYKWRRLAYGLSNSPEEFQCRIHECLDGLVGVFCIADDILVFGLGNSRSEADKNHDINVLALMERLRDRNMKINPKKVQFKLQKITFMGMVISEDGVQPDPNKVTAISQMPQPEDRPAVLRFCGMANYLSSFCPNLSTAIQPLHNLGNEKGHFLWLPEHQTAFQRAKELIVSAPCLSYFDVTKPVTLQVDASQRGLGAALMQPSECEKLQPVAFASCQMRPNEEIWAQIEKECLAILAACNKWDQWIYGLNVTVHTDHQPLETIFKKPLSAAPRRLQKMMLQLQRYKIHVVYKKGSTLHVADTLSRATLSHQNDSDEPDFNIFRIELEHDVPSNEGLTSLTLLQLRVQTLKDDDMQLLAKTIVTGWPSSKDNLSPSLCPYWTFKEEMTVQDGLIYKGSQVVVPTAMRKTMLQKIHGAHLGAEPNYRMCRDVLFWPGMKAEIIDTCSTCGKCAQFNSENQKEPMMSHPIPTYPWQYVSQDIFEFEAEAYLVTVDHYSDFIEVDKLPNTLASTIVEKTEPHFSRNGAPAVVVSDNGPQFISHEYADLCDRYGTKHVTSSPYWAQGNGKAEASVKILKMILYKCGKKRLWEGLLNQRNTPPQFHDKSPAQRSMGRRTRGLIPVAERLLIPEGHDPASVRNAIHERRKQAKIYYDRKAGPTRPEVSIGDTVYLKPSPRNRGKPWMYGVVTEKPTPRSYVVESPDGRKIRRTSTQVRQSNVPPASPPRVMLQESIQMPYILPEISGPDMTPHMDTSVPVSSMPAVQTVTRSSPDAHVGSPTNVQSAAESRHATNSATPTKYMTRSGRESKKPQRLDL